MTQTRFQSIRRLLVSVRARLADSAQRFRATVDHLVHIALYVTGLRADHEQLAKRLVEESGRRAVGFRVAHDDVMAMRKELTAALDRLAFYEWKVVAIRRERDAYNAYAADRAEREAEAIAAATPPQPPPIAPDGVFVPPQAERQA